MAAGMAVDMAAGTAVRSVADIAARTPVADSVEAMEEVVTEVAAMVVADGGGDSFNTSTSCSTFK